MSWFRDSAAIAASHKWLTCRSLPAATSRRDLAPPLLSQPARKQRTMLRITQRDGGLVVEGSAAGPWVGELSRAAETLLAHTDEPQIDLSAVSYVDNAGAELLRDLDSRMAIRATGFVT